MRVHLRTVSANGHSQAVSMWAWPVATIRWAPERAGTASTVGQGGTGGGRRAVAPARRSGDDVERPRDGGADAGPAGVGEGERAHDAVEDVEVVDERLGVGVDDDQLGPVEPVQRLVPGGVRRAQRRRAELRDQRVRRRLDDELDGPRLAGHRHGLAAGVDALHRPTLGVADETLALEAGRVEPEAEVEQGLDAAARPGGRDRAGEAEPRRRPTVGPSADRRRTGRGRRATVRPPPSSARRSGWTSGSTRSATSRVMRSSTSSRSSCIASFWRPGTSRRAHSRLPGRVEMLCPWPPPPPPTTTTTTTTTTSSIAACSSTCPRCSPDARCCPSWPVPAPWPSSPPVERARAGPARRRRRRRRHDRDHRCCRRDRDRGRPLLTDPRGDRRAVPGRRLQRPGHPRRERRGPSRHHGQLRFVDERGRGRAADHRADDHRQRRRLRAARRRRRVPVALRPGRQLLDVLGAGRELPARRAGDRRRRHG